MMTILNLPYSYVARLRRMSQAQHLSFLFAGKCTANEWNLKTYTTTFTWLPDIAKKCGELATNISVKRKIYVFFSLKIIGSCCGTRRFLEKYICRCCLLLSDHAIPWNQMTDWETTVPFSVGKSSNVGIAIINHPFLMVYTTHLWWWLGDGLLLLHQHYKIRQILVVGDRYPSSRP